MNESDATTQPQHQGRAMELEMRTTASPEQIWNAWVNPARISQWFADRAEGWAHKGAEISWLFDEFGQRIPYHVVESVPGECVMLGGQIAGRIPFLLEVRIRRDAGVTAVRLVNSGFLEGGSFDEEYEGVVSGWKLALAMLKYYAENHYGIDKQQFLLMREAQFELRHLPARYTQPGLLNAWLTTEAYVGAGGEPCMLKLIDGPRIEGYTAAISRREAAFVWPDRNTLLELKGWGAGEKKILAVRVTGWNAHGLQQLRPIFERSLDRLTALAGTVAL